MLKADYEDIWNSGMSFVHLVEGHNLPSRLTTTPQRRAQSWTSANASPHECFNSGEKPRYGDADSPGFAFRPVKDSQGSDGSIRSQVSAGSQTAFEAPKDASPQGEFGNWQQSRAFGKEQQPDFFLNQQEPVSHVPENAGLSAEQPTTFTLMPDTPAAKKRSTASASLPKAPAASQSACAVADEEAYSSWTISF